MSLGMDTLDTQQEIDRIVQFLQETFEKTQKSQAIVAISGGIDSALSLSLVAKALPPHQIHPLFLPYNGQSIEDSQRIAAWNKIPEENWETLAIDPVVSSLETFLSTSSSDRLRKGNVMARVRMIAVFDRAKKWDALVCGTENKSEHYLGYFTRFGDAASDIEPIAHLYKTQVRELVRFLGLPSQFLQKAPSAGLWSNQTDEQEMGFSYEDADRVIAYYLKEAPKPELSTDSIEKILTSIDRNAFKRVVPYTLAR